VFELISDFMISNNLYICLELSNRFLSLCVALYSVLHTKYYPCDQIKKNEMSGACGTCVGEERCIKGFGSEI
jgi:hypothetical protein